MTPDSIGLKDNLINLTSRSGRAAVKHRMAEMGYQEGDYNLDELYADFLQLADKKGQVFDYDLEALVFMKQQHRSRNISRWRSSTPSQVPASKPPRWSECRRG